MAQSWCVLAVVAVSSFRFSYAAHRSCVDPGPPVSQPEAGTPRASYCGVADSGSPWLLTIAPILIVTLAIVLGRRRKAVVVAAVVLALAAVIANSAVIDSLDYAYTI